MARPLWTSEEVLAATEGRLAGAAFAAEGVTFDTRELQPGDLFVALKGARDGHTFLAEAFARGAAAAIVSEPVEGGPLVKVDDTLAALGALAAFARDRAPEVRRGAVTGSVGKTGVTQAIAAGLRLVGTAHSSVKSFNNHIGVPLTLARMPRDADRAVFEIGMNHAGEIRPLTKLVQPHAACVTNVGPVHIENFPDGEAGVARAKSEIFEGLGPGGVAVINADSRWLNGLKEAALHVGARVMTFGSDEAADARLLDFQPEVNGSRVSARIWGHDYVFTVAQTGFHWGLNAMAVLLMLEALDVPLEAGLQALSTFEPLAGRGLERRLRVAGGEFVLIDESYNANPMSMRATLASLAARQPGGEGRRMVALTDMLELGSDAPALHSELAEAIETADVHLVFLAGPLMKSLWEALPQSRRGAWCETAEQLAPKVVEAVGVGDTVMVKGSNGSRASVIAKALSDSDYAARETA